MGKTKVERARESFLSSLNYNFNLRGKKLISTLNGNQFGN